MKIKFSVANADALICAVVVENKPFLVNELRSLFNGDVARYKGAANTDIVINVDKAIQDAGKYTGGTFTSSANMITLQENQIETFGELTRTEVTAFQRGVSYLIPVAYTSVLRMIPNFIADPVANDNSVVCASHYVYDCPVDTGLLGTTSLSNCIQFKRSGVAIAAKDANSAQKKMAQAINFGAAIGAPEMVNAANRLG